MKEINRCREQVEELEQNIMNHLGDHSIVFKKDICKCDEKQKNASNDSFIAQYDSIYAI